MLINQFRHLLSGCIFLTCLLAFCQAASADDLHYSQHELDIELANWRWLPVTGQGLPPEQGDWKVPASGLEFLFKKRVWLRVDINFEAVPERTLFFFVPNNFIDDVHISLLHEWKPHSAWLIGAGADHHDVAVDNAFLSVPLRIDKAGRYSLLFNLPSTQATQLLVKSSLVPELKSVTRPLLTKYTWGSGIYAAMITYIFLMTILLIYRFQLKMLYALFFATSISLAVLGREGLLYLVGGFTDPWIFQQYVLSMVMFSIAFSLLYIYEDMKNRIRQRWLRYALVVFAVLSCLLALTHLFERLFLIPIVGMLAYGIFIIALSLLIGSLVYRVVVDGWFGKILSLAWLLFVLATLMRFASALYPQVALTDSVWWNLASTHVMAWIVVNYLWTVAQERFDQERLRSASESRIDLVNRLSHELRTPLNAVIGLADLLKTKNDPETVQNYATMIQSSGQNLLGLVNDILDFSRIESSNIELADKPFRLDQVLLDVNVVFMKQMLEVDVLPSIYIEPSTPIFLRGDELRLKQILMNLLGNAIKFSKRGGVVEVRVQPGLRSDNAVELLWQVSDDGRGVPLELQDKIFEPYQQAEIRDATELKGTGLGLAITQLLVRQMGGTISLQSAPGEGSSFSFNLYLSLDPAAPDTRAIYTPMRDKKILFCTSIPELRDLFADNLRYHQLQVDCIASPAELEAYPQDFDVLLIDAILTLTQDQLPRLQSLPESVAVCILMLDPPTWLEGLDAKQFMLARLPKPFLNVMADISSFVSGQELQFERGDETLPELKTGDHHILLVDDNVVNLTVAEKLLDSLSVTSVSAQSGQEALKLLRRDHGQFSLVLLDCEMPVLDGFETCKQLREYERSEGLEPIPVVALTAHALNEVRDVCLQAGMNDVLYKPVNREILARLLARF